MAKSVIERDYVQQGNFGQQLIQFGDDMHATCQSLKGHITEAYVHIQEDNARAVLDDLLELVQEIEAELPGTEEFGTEQKKLAKRIGEAADFRFTRR